jgi:uncharacterized repeat protein (TIGR02543 family)
VRHPVSKYDTNSTPNNLFPPTGKHPHTMKKRLYLFLLLLLTFRLAAVGQSLTFSATRGFYEAPFQLTLSTSIAGGTIRYTTDGSLPTATTGTVYTGAIPVGTTSVVRAIGYSGATTTAVTTHSYLFLNDVLHQPKTIAGWPNHDYALGAGTATATHDYEMDPKVVNDPAYSSVVKAGLTSIPTMSLVLNKDDFWDLYEGETEHPTSVEMFYPDGTKEQFNCDLEGHSHNRLKRSLALSFNGSTTSNLLKKAPFNSATVATTFKNTQIVLRSGNNRSWARNWNPDRTCYTRDEWYRQTQQAISGVGGRGTFVHLYVNGLYWGLYNPVERTDAGMLSNYYGGAFDDWMSMDPDGIRSGDPTRFNYLTTTLINQDMSVPANYTQLKSYLDVSKFCDYLIVTWMTGMTDWPGNNYHGAQRNTPPGPFWYNTWDCEWSWDVTNGSNQGAWVHPDFRNDQAGTATISKIWHSARRNKEFMQLFADRVYKACFNNGGLTDAASRARWAQVNDYIKTAIVDESARWGDALQDGITRTRDGYWTPEVNRVDGLMNGNADRFITALVAQGYYPALTPPSFGQEGGTVAPGYQLTIANPNATGTIYYTTNGSDPQMPDGTVAPGALTYSGPVAITGSQTVRARIQNGSTWSALHEASFTISGLISGLFINEFMASNTKKTDEFGEYDDWIEIYNSSNQPVNIGGLYITDLLTNLTQWQIPTTDALLTTIPAKGYLVLWADGQPAQGPLHVNIQLAKKGEAIGLSQMIGTTPTVLDSYTFGAQTDDVSVGRFPDGSSTFKSFFSPTPGSTNVIPFKANLFINEFLASNQNSIKDENGEHDGWIEVYNNNTDPVDIGGLYLTNNLTNRGLYKIPTTSPAQTTIPAKGFLTLWADNQPTQGVLHLGFTLNAAGGEIGLSDIIGPDASLINSASYSTQAVDVSRGRYPDAGAQFKAFNVPTPGATNTAPAISNVFINEFMADNTKLADENGDFDDWIELYNAGNQPVDIGGLYITDDLTNPTKYQIPTTSPALTTIPAKGFLLLWADDQAFQGILHVGIKLSASGEQIGLYQPNGTAATAIDTRTFTAQTTDVSSGREQDGAANFISFAVPTPNASNNTVSTTFTLTTSVGGSGTVSRSPNSATYASGSTVTLTATPAAGFTFSGWSGDATGSTNPLAVVMTANKTVTATFTAIPSPPTSGSTVVYRLNAGGGAQTNALGTFAADQYFAPSPGNTFATSTTIAGTSSSSLYQTERYGSAGQFAYALPVANGTYTVVLHFAELYWTAVDKRVFDVSLEGTKVLDNYDIFKKVGALTATTETFTATVTDGMLNVAFSSLASDGGADQPKVSAIEVLSNAAPTPGNPLPVANAGADKTITLPTNSVSLVGSGTDDGSIKTYAWTQAGGPAGASPATLSGANTATLTASGLVAGTYLFNLVVTDNLDQASPADQVQVIVNPAPVVGGPAVVSLTLINADTEQPLHDLVAGEVLNLATLPTRNLNVRANTSPTTVGSVRFALSGAQVQNQTETAAPYALFGDNNGNYNAWTPALGAYTLTATPYSGASATGTAGTPLTLSFSVTNQAASTAASMLASRPATAPSAAQTTLEVYPNPSSTGHFHLRLPDTFSGEVRYTLLSVVGATVGRGSFAMPETPGVLDLDLSQLMTATGVYYLRIEGPNGPSQVKLLRN